MRGALDQARLAGGACFVRVPRPAASSLTSQNKLPRLAVPSPAREATTFADFQIRGFFKTEVACLGPSRASTAPCRSHAASPLGRWPARGRFASACLTSQFVDDAAPTIHDRQHARSDLSGPRQGVRSATPARGCRGPRWAETRKTISKLSRMFSLPRQGWHGEAGELVL